MIFAQLPFRSMEAGVVFFLVVAGPVVILMTVWTIVMMVRILFPERELPYDPSARRKRAREQGRAVPVRFRDLVEDQCHAEAPAMPHQAPTGANSVADVPDALVDDLWLRRN